MDAIMPVAAHANSTRVIRPSTPEGDAIAVIASATSCRVDDDVVHLLVPQDKTEDRHDHDRQRHDREQDSVGDAGRKLRAPVGEVAIHGRHEDTQDPACGTDAPLPDAPG